LPPEARARRGAHTRPAPRRLPRTLDPELAAETAKRGVAWDDEIDEPRAFTIGLQAVSLTVAGLVPLIGRPVAVQRELEYSLAPGLEWLSGVAERLSSMSSWAVWTVASGALSTVRSGCRLRRRAAAEFSASLRAASGLGR
jgi:hypothetical protein